MHKDKALELANQKIARLLKAIHNTCNECREARGVKDPNDDPICEMTTCEFKPWRKTNEN
jgi:hypothetical protein